MHAPHVLMIDVDIDLPVQLGELPLLHYVAAAQYVAGARPDALEPAGSRSEI